MRLDFSLVSACLLAGVVAGCGKAPEAEFVLSDGAKGLVEDARKAVEKTVREDFGTPEHLVAWEKFPIDYGAPQQGDKESADKASADKPPAGGPPVAAEHAAAAGSSTSAHGATAATVNDALISHRLEVDKSQPGWKLKEGRNLYMRHCLHCHGVSGDGNGTTAAYLNPRPRDYRLGIFKFTSTISGVKASRADLTRTLKEGIPGTSMPSFVLLADESVDALVEYVRWLSIRGEFEKRLVAELAGDYSKATIAQRVSQNEKRADILKALDVYLKGENGAAPEYVGVVEEVASGLATDWSAPEEQASVIVPKVKRTDPVADSESILRGRKLYMSDRTKCYTCHGVGGKGDGTSTVNYWVIPNVTPEMKFPDRGLHDAWGFPQKPRNLTQGIYRGGRRPVDLYRRVFAGIKGTQMPAFGVTVLNDNEIWDVVNYVLSVPYQPTPPPILQASGK